MEGILHSTPDGPSLCLQGGKQNGGGPRHQREACEEVSWEETSKDLQVKPKGAMEKPWLLAISTVKALMHTQGFYWERDTGFTVASNILTAQGSWDLLCQVQERRGCHTGP